MTHFLIELYAVPKIFKLKNQQGLVWYDKLSGNFLRQIPPTQNTQGSLVHFIIPSSLTLLYSNTIILKDLPQLSIDLHLTLKNPIIKHKILDLLSVTPPKMFYLQIEFYCAYNCMSFLIRNWTSQIFIPVHVNLYGHIYKSKFEIEDQQKKVNSIEPLPKIPRNF